MTNALRPRPVGGGHRGNTLGLRLALAFLGVALAAVALIAVLTAVFSAVDVSSLASRQRDELAGAFAVAAGSAWHQHQGWAGADLKQATDLAGAGFAAGSWGAVLSGGGGCDGQARA